jgi:hypothetical protein
MCDQPLQALAKIKLHCAGLPLPPVISLGKKWIIPRDTVMTRLFCPILWELRCAG